MEPFHAEVKIPGLFGEDPKGETIDNTLLGRYIKAVYVYFIWVVGILAVIMLIWGGIRWVAAAGNPSQITVARDVIQSAIIGLIIALTSVLLLNTISPKLVSIGIPSLVPVSSIYITGASKVCPLVADLKSNIECGEFKKIGTTTDSKGNQIDDLCIGVLCGYGTDIAPFDNLTLYPERRVCNLSQAVGTTTLMTGQGCIAEVPITSKAGEDRFNSVSTASVTNIPLNFSFGCGHVSPKTGIPGFESDAGTEYRFGYSCNFPGSTFLVVQQPVCYMIGDRAIVKEAWGDGGQAENSYCPTEME